MRGRYNCRVAAFAVTGFRSPSPLQTDSRFRAAFLCPVLAHAYAFRGGPGRETFGSAGELEWAGLRTLSSGPPPSFAARTGSPSIHSRRPYGNRT